MREGEVPPAPVQPAPQVSSAPKAAPSTAPKAASSSAGAGTAAASADKFMPLADNPEGRKIALICAGVSTALNLFLLLAGRAAFTAILAPAILFVLLMMNKDVDSYLMAIPITLNAVLSLLNILNLSNYMVVPAIFYIFFLISVAAAVVYWLLALKKALPTNKATGLLLLLFAVIALLDLINLFSALSYGIISALSVLASIAYIVSYFAAIFFAGKHLLGSLKK